MYSHCGLPVSPAITINNQPIEMVQQNCYLGSTVACTPNLDVEFNKIGKHIGKAASTFGGLRLCVWESEKVTLKTKVCVYDPCVLSVLLYGSETWPAYRNQECQLNTFHLRCLQKITYISWRDMQRLEICGSINLFIVPHKWRPCWLGHVDRMEDCVTQTNTVWPALSWQRIFIY